MEKLEVGDKYLSCSVKVGDALQKVLEAVSKGESYVWFSSFPNANYKEDKHPSYTGDINVWVKEKKAKKEDVKPKGRLL